MAPDCLDGRLFRMHIRPSSGFAMAHPWWERSHGARDLNSWMRSSAKKEQGLEDDVAGQARDGATSRSGPLDSAAFEEIRMTIGYIGLGAMGRALAGRLAG